VTGVQTCALPIYRHGVVEQGVAFAVNALEKQLSDNKLFNIVL